VLQKCTRVYPVDCDRARVIPAVPLESPPAGHTRYFAYHNCKKLIVGGTTVETASCGGRFCDRQNPMESAPGVIVPCGCFHRKDKYRIVTEHYLHIPCLANVSPKLWTVVENFRSLRFDELLFREGSQRVFDTLEMGDPVANRVLRARVRKLVEHVNNRHGWTIVGWVRTGLVKDANEEGNREAEDIAAEDVSPHVTYLYPTDPSDVDPEKVEEYKELLITEDAFRREVKEEQQRLQAENESNGTSSKRTRHS